MNIAMFSCVSFYYEAFGREKESNYFYSYLKETSSVNDQRHDAHDEDKALKEVYELGCVVYKNIVELVVLYYCKDMILDAHILYDKILIDTCNDVLRMAKLLALYVPLVYKNKKTSKKAKFFKLASVGCVITILLSSLHVISRDQILKKQES